MQKCLMLFLFLLTMSCATRPSPQAMSQWTQPQTHLSAFGGVYRNTRSERTSFSPNLGEVDSLYHLLTLYVPSIRRLMFQPDAPLRPDVSLQAKLQLLPISDTKMRAILIDNGQVVATSDLRLTLQEGFLYSRRQFILMPLLIVNGYMDRLYALGLDEAGDLHVFQSRIGVAGFLIFLAPNRTLEHLIFTRIHD